MSHIRSGFSGVNVPIGSDGSSHNTITNNVIINKEKEAKKEGVEEVSEGIYVVYPPNPNQERDLKSAQDRLNEIKEAQPDNDRLIKALSLIVDMLYNNPMYVNKWVVSEMETLKELIRLLTDAEDVQVTTTDPACDCGGCCGKSSAYIMTIDSIYLRYDDVIKEFRYCCPAAKQILENCHISTKLVVVKA